MTKLEKLDGPVDELGGRSKPVQGGASKSRTQAAIEWLEAHPGQTVYAAAKALGLAPTTLYRAVRQREATKDLRCPTCGQLIRDEGHARDSAQER